MNHEDLIKRLDSEACYEAIYTDSDGRRILIIRTLELYSFSRIHRAGTWACGCHLTQWITSGWQRKLLLT